MKTHVRIAAAMLGSLACLSLAGISAASDRETRHHKPRGGHDLPGEIIETDIYDPLGLVRGKLVSVAKGFGFTEGPATDRDGNVYFTDQPNDKIYRWDEGTERSRCSSKEPAAPTARSSTATGISLPPPTCTASSGRSAPTAATRCWSTITKANC